jgi:predicted N-acetyltransferase YhbS
MSLVSFSIRHFRNTDTAHLTRIWNLHHSASRSCDPISNSVFDACVIAKPFFVAEDLLILEDDGSPVGFVHVGYGGNEAKSNIDHQNAMLSCLCVEPHRDEESIADNLIQAAIGRIEQHSSSHVIAIGSPASYAFYIGVAAGDGLMGVVATDSRLQRWLGHNRFEPSRPTECWEVDLASFRPPMDRGQFAVRRAASVVRVLDELHEQWWDAVVLGHTEQIRFQLFSRQHSAITNEVSFWYTDQAFSGISSQAARIWLPKFPDDTEGRDRYVFLLSEAFRQLQSERFSTVRAIAAPDQQASVSVLQRLSFRSVLHGLIFERRLRVAPKLA